MPALTVDDVQWYVVTRKDTKAHFVLNEKYVAVYEQEFERIREFDTVGEATAAHAIREAADDKGTTGKDRKLLQLGKLRGDIKKGSVEDEDVRAAIRKEIMEEMKAADAIKPPSSEATVGPKSKARTKATKE